MRWFWFACLLLMLTALLGCEGNEAPAPERSSLLTFRYDAARDVVIAHTTPLTSATPVTPQLYADALEVLPDVSYAPATTLRLADPNATVTDGVLTVNYQDARGLEGLASAQLSAVMAALDAWWWVPSVREVRVQANGTPLTQLGQAAVTQPLTRAFHTYVVQPQTGEVGYLVGSLSPATLAEAIAILQRREIREFPATQGFVPLLPPEVTMAVSADQLADGVLPVGFSGNFSRTEHARLAGITLMFTQFPPVNAVRFTFGGQTLDELFMRGNLNAPVTPYELLLPTDVGQIAPAATTQAVRAALQNALGAAPASISPVRVWREWAAVTLIPTAGAEPELAVLRASNQTYTVLARGTNLTVDQLMQRNVTRDAIVALRLPGWEAIAALSDR